MLIFAISTFVLAAVSLLLYLFLKEKQQRVIAVQNFNQLEIDLESQTQLLKSYQKQTEQFSLSAASMISIRDEKVLFKKIAEDIVEYSDFERVLISLFHEHPARRELIGYAGVSADLVQKVKNINLDISWYDDVFEKGILLSQFSYYIPHLMKDILNQEATIYGNGEFPNDDNSWHPEDNLFVKMIDEDGQFVGVISVDNSKSGLKPNEDIVRPLEFYSSLVSQVILLKRNQKHREQLEGQLRQAQKMEAIGNLTGGIAHDFNNVLGVIIGHVEMALRIEPDNNVYNSHLKEIQVASRRARDIVQHLLTFSRKKEKELRTIKISDTVKDSIKFLRSTIPTTVELNSNINIDGCVVLADPTQIYQIVLNLCTNSSHAMEVSGGTLFVGAEEVQMDSFDGISSKTIEPGRYVKLTVKDTGHGIDEDVLHLIYDPYFTTKDVGKGTGMGLAIVHGIVESHKGAIHVQSNPGYGCQFDIYLPVFSGEIEQKMEPQSKLVGGSETIMVVDDESGLLSVIQQQLGRQGYRVEAYEDPEKAFDIFKMEPESYDLIITDMTMPKMTGEVFAKKVLGIRPDIPVFLCTGYSDQIDEEGATKAGISKFFHKPIPFTKLAKEIRKALDN